jgi:xanthine dehydrogenase YagT iron-sulfur-binding subunit
VWLLHAGTDRVGGRVREGGHAGTDADIREYMSGNLCRCAAYPNIVEAINLAKTRMKEA